MNKLRMIEKLGFKPYLIEDHELREECESILKTLLSDYFIDDKIHDIYANKIEGEEVVIDYSNSIQLCRGFNKYNDSYDFFSIKNKIDNIMVFILRPTLQSKFSSEKFGESVRLVYKMNEGQFEVNRISKYNGDLLHENHLYIRDSKTNDLVLISEQKLYYSDDVKYAEANDSKVGKLRRIYYNGEYVNNNIIPISSELYVTSKTNKIVKVLYINDLDTGLDMIDGTTIYNIDDNNNIKFVLSQDNIIGDHKSLMENFKANIRAYEKIDTKNCLIKTRK